MLQEYRISDNGEIITFDKVANAIELLKMHEPPEGYYVAFSGGKDSVVILDLVKRSGVKYDAHYNVTTVDPPELVQFIKREHPYVGWNMPKMSMWQLIQHKGFPPTRVCRYCCSVLKEGGGAGRRVVTGVRWAESHKRSKRRSVEQCNKNKSSTYINPIIDWEDEDVWKYILKTKIPYCDLYNEGFRRLGCILCPMQGEKGMLVDAKRWPKHYRAYLRAFDKMIQNANRNNKTYEKWHNGQDVMDWWIYNPPAGDPDQGVLFE